MKAEGGCKDSGPRQLEMHEHMPALAREGKRKQNRLRLRGALLIEVCVGRRRRRGDRQLRGLLRCDVTVPGSGAVPQPLAPGSYRAVR